MQKLKFSKILEVFSQILTIVILVVGLDFLLLKWVPIKILEIFSTIILILAVFFLAWRDSKKKE